MGYISFYFKSNSMRDIRARLEAETGMTIKSMKFGFAVAVYDEQAMAKDNTPRPELLNYISIIKWSKSNGELYIKEIGEDMGPAIDDVPLKYVLAHCKFSENSEYSKQWRNRIIEKSKVQKQIKKLIKVFAPGDNFFYDGRRYSYVRNYTEREIIGRSALTAQDYRLKIKGISMVI